MKTGYNAYFEDGLEVAKHLNKYFCSIFSEVNDKNKLGVHISFSIDGSFSR